MFKPAERSLVDNPVHNPLITTWTERGRRWINTGKWVFPRLINKVKHTRLSINTLRLSVHGKQFIP